MKANYQQLALETRALTRDVPHFIANLANVSALIWQRMEGINWAGFYLMEGDMLVLGPFQGKPACIEIPLGKGVCGTSALKKEAILVEDVHEFPGHIACDSASRSEIVLPILVKGKVEGVLDIDSPLTGRFSREDLEGLTEVVEAVQDFWPAP